MWSRRRFVFVVLCRIPLDVLVAVHSKPKLQMDSISEVSKSMIAREFASRPCYFSVRTKPFPAMLIELLDTGMELGTGN